MGTPVYRASFSGLFKHFFDFIDQYALEGKPVFLAASGGSERHSLVLEHNLRPLFSFFKTYTLPMAVYVSEQDFDHGEIQDNSKLKQRINRAVQQAHPILDTMLYA